MYGCADKGFERLNSENNDDDVVVVVVLYDSTLFYLVSELIHQLLPPLPNPPDGLTGGDKPKWKEWVGTMTPTRYQLNSEQTPSSSVKSA